MLCHRKSPGRHWSPLPVGTDPKLRVDFVFGNDLALQKVAVQQVVVHGLRDDFGDGRRLEFDEAVVFRLASLDHNETMTKTGRREINIPFCFSIISPLLPRRTERSMLSFGPQRNREALGQGIEHHDLQSKRKSQRMFVAS